MKEFSTSGTLGDVYIICLKLLTLGNIPIKVYHCTTNIYWYPEIKSIYGLFSNIEVEFVTKDKRRTDLPLIEALPTNQNIVHFPESDLKSNIEKPYNVLLVNSGKPRSVGKNTKEINPETIKSTIDKCDKKIVLLGTSDLYTDIQDCVNLVGKTSLIEAMAITKDADSFAGPAGLISFVAISHKVRSNILCKQDEKQYYEETPWMNYCTLYNI